MSKMTSKAAEQGSRSIVDYARREILACLAKVDDSCVRLRNWTGEVQIRCS